MARIYPQSVFEGEVYPTRDGDIRVLRYYSALEVEVQFVSTGYVRMTSAGEIRRQRLKDRYKPSVFGIGYLGEGKFRAKTRTVNTQAYVTWHNMIKRCYSEKYQVKYPYWKDCTVTDEWHNFQNFANWFYNNHIEGYDLDKDMKIKNNRTYSPEGCSYISPVINRSTQDSPNRLNNIRKL